MISSSESAARGMSVGFDAGWRADFRADGAVGLAAPPVVSVGRGDYDARIRIDSDASFRAPTFELSIEGLSDQDYEAIAGQPCPHVSIALGWRDAASTFVAGLSSAVGAFGVGSDVDGLPDVLLGRITRVERAAVDVHYVTTFFGVGAAFARLGTTLSTDVAVDAGRPLIDYVSALCALASPPIGVVAEDDQPALDGSLDVPPGLPLTRVIVDLERVARAGPASVPVPIFLRDGSLHLGAWEGPVTGGTEYELAAATGLVDVVPAPTQAAAPVPENPFALTVSDEFVVAMLGRPDIAVGDVVNMSVPEVVPTTTAGGSGLGALGLLVRSTVAVPDRDVVPPPRRFRVTGVTHRLDRTSGFTTTLHVVRRVSAVPGQGDGAQTGTQHRVVEAIDARARELATARRPLDVGVVNRQSVAPEQDGATAARAQRLQVRSGLVDAPAPNVPVRSPSLEHPTQLVDKPYLTPFAFGRTGLVLPHYPGTRVLHVNHGDDVRNAVVAGCLWGDGDEPSSEPGDFWLTLPTGVSAAEASDDPASQRPAGKVSSDLIDGRGVRQLGVRSLHVHVGEASMPEVGDRPAQEAVDELVLSSTQGSATIRFDAQGNIEISTSAEIRFTARKVTFDVDESVDVR